MKTVAIMQPTFIPWIGYFGMIQSVDIFVFLDDVQFTKRSWQCRNWIKTTNGPHLLSLSIDKRCSRMPINETKLASTGFENDLLANLNHCLKKAPHFSGVHEVIASGFESAAGNLAMLNQFIVQEVCKQTKIKTEFFRSSEFNLTKSDKSQRLLEICQILDADQYLSAMGSLDYLLENDVFQDSGIELLFFNYDHPVYKQLYGSFVPFMSFVDCLANEGPQSFPELVKSGVREPMTVYDLS